MKIFKNVCFVFLAFVFFIGCRKKDEPDIWKIVICNGYFEDYKSAGFTSANISKFAVVFYGGGAESSFISDITVKGPSGFYFKINAHNKYERKNPNGYISRETGQGVWYHALRQGVLEDEGIYTIRVRYKSGKVTAKSRMLKKNDELLKSYMKIKKRFSPSGDLQPGSSLSNIKLTWNILPETDAYYAVRAALDKSGHTFAGDAIFIDDPFFRPESSAHKNKSSSVINFELMRNTKYKWFCEILDADEIDKVNFVIFQKIIKFKTP
jgi:hypothetical protein